MGVVCTSAEWRGLGSRSLCGRNGIRRQASVGFVNPMPGVYQKGDGPQPSSLVKVKFKMCCQFAKATRRDKVDLYQC